MSFKFAVIGGGLTATSFLCQLVDKISLIGTGASVVSSKLSVVVFEKKQVFGPGLPHSDQFVLPFHITNMCAKDMSVRIADPGDFQDWVKNNRDALQNKFPELHDAFACPDCTPDQCRHYPRAVMGEYLMARFKQSVRSARELGISVSLKPNSEVTDLRQVADGILLKYRDADTTADSDCSVDGVLLATGHWFEKPGNKNYFTSPWPASLLRQGIPEGENVGVIGSSLSAIEVALTLFSDGRFERQATGELVFYPPANPRNIVFYSRQGLMPRVRGLSGLRPNRFFTCDAIRRMIADKPGGLKLSDIYQLLDKELSSAYGTDFSWHDLMNMPDDPAQRLREDIHSALCGDGPDGELIWQTVLLESFPVARDLYLNLALEDRKRFDRNFTTVFFMHAATQPVINAEKLLALIEGGFVSIVKLGDGYELNREPSGNYQLIYKDPEGQKKIAEHRYIVDARGQPRSIETDSSELTRNLLRRGIVQSDERWCYAPTFSFDTGADRAKSSDHPFYRSGSMLIDPETHQVVAKDFGDTGWENRSIFAIGAMTRGQIIDASMAYGIIRSTATIVDWLTATLSGI